MQEEYTHMTDDELLTIKANNLLHKNYILDIKSEQNKRHSKESEGKK